MSEVEITRKRKFSQQLNGEAGGPDAKHESVEEITEEQKPQKGNEQSFYDGLCAGALTFFFGGLFMAIVMVIAIAVSK